MKDDEARSLDEHLSRLRDGIYSERVESAAALGDSGNLQAIPYLRRALKRLRPPRPPANQAGETSGTSSDDLLVYDPDETLRMAIVEAVTNLLLNADKSDTPETRKLRSTVSQAIDFADGSRLNVWVEAPRDAGEDLASTIYFEQLLPLINQVGGQPGDLQH
jgi:hypothetical protein